LEVERRSKYPQAYQTKSNNEEGIPFTLEESLQVRFGSVDPDPLGGSDQVSLYHGSHEDLTSQETAETEVGGILDGSGEWVGGHQVVEHNGYDDPYSSAPPKCFGGGD
jgi:hypothetical protein